jgi:PRTRC genetic system protein E
MSLFQAIAPMLVDNDLSLLVTRTDDQISVTFIPKGKEGRTAAVQPFTWTATAEELDRNCESGLTNIATSAKSLAEQIAETQAIIESQKKAEANKGTKALASKAKGSTPPVTLGHKPEGGIDLDEHDLTPPADDEETGDDAAPGASKNPLLD